MSARRNVQQSPTEVGVTTDPSAEVFAGVGSLPADVLKLAVCAGSGVVFGFAAEKGRGTMVTDKVVYSRQITTPLCCS